MTCSAICARSGLREMVDWRVVPSSRRTHTSVSPVSLVRNWNRQLTGSPCTVPINQPSASHGVLGISLPRVALPNPSLVRMAQPWYRRVVTKVQYHKTFLYTQNNMHELLCVVGQTCASCSIHPFEG
jgi:hypothetical protein